MADNETLPKIAENIKAIRLQRNLTIKQLADQSRVTKGLLSKIENSRTIPSLPVFVQILKSLDISFQDFFQTIDSGNKQKYILIRKEKLMASISERQPCIGYQIIIEKAIPSSTVGISLLNINRNTNRSSEIGPGCRFDYLISGSCEYQLTNNEVIYMGPGDSIFFNGPMDNFALNTSDNDVLILVIRFHF